MTVTPRDRTPYIESAALKAKLSGIRVTASNYPSGIEVPVGFVNPDFEIKSAAYPGIYLSYAGMNRAQDREHRGPTLLEYAPPGLPVNVQVPRDIDNKDSTETESWGLTFDRRTSPYAVPEHPVPYNLDYNVTVLTRNYEQMFQIISQLDDIERIPARYGSLAVPEDGTLRTLDLLGGPETSPIKDEDGKRVLQTVYSVRVTAEINLYDVETVHRVNEIDLQISATRFTL